MSDVCASIEMIPVTFSMTISTASAVSQVQSAATHCFDQSACLSAGVLHNGTRGRRAGHGHGMAWLAMAMTGQGLPKLTPFKYGWHRLEAISIELETIWPCEAWRNAMPRVMGARFTTTIKWRDLAVLLVEIL